MSSEAIPSSRYQWAFRLGHAVTGIALATAGYSEKDRKVLSVALWFLSGVSFYVALSIPPHANNPENQDPLDLSSRVQHRNPSRPPSPAALQDGATDSGTWVDVGYPHPNEAIPPEPVPKPRLEFIRKNWRSCIQQ